MSGDLLKSLKWSFRPVKSIRIIWNENSYKCRILPSIWTLSKYPDSLKHWYKKMLINILSNFCKVVSKWVTELKKTSSLSNCPVVMGNLCSWGSSNVAQWFMKNWAGFMPRAKNLWMKGLLLSAGGFLGWSRWGRQTSLNKCGGSHGVSIYQAIKHLRVLRKELQ